MPKKGDSKKKVYPRFAEDLRQLMANKGLSDVEIAKAVGSHRGTVQRWRLGSSRPRGEKMSILSGLLGVPIAQLERDNPEHVHLSPVEPTDLESRGLLEDLQHDLRRPGARPRVIKVVRQSDVGSVVLCFLPSSDQLPDDLPIEIQGDLDIDLKTSFDDDD